MTSFIKAAEIWLPSSSGRFLTLGEAEYGDLTEFAQSSSEMVFALGEGLPGATWKAQTPLLWTDLTDPHFRRSEQAGRAGISCGLSIPIMAGEFVLAVVVLFFGSEPDLVGAVEIWQQSEENTSELKLLDGYYGELERFEWVSRRLAILKGRGLPGTAWAQERPLIMADLGQTNSFLRARNAAECGISVGLAIPVYQPDGRVQVVTILSAKGTPIAHQFELWVPDINRESLKFDSGHSQSIEDLNKYYADQRVVRGEDTLGDSWQSGRPILIKGDDGPRQLVLPLVRRGVLDAMVRLYF